MLNYQPETNTIEHLKYQHNSISISKNYFDNPELLHNGKLGKNVTIEQGQEAARLCVINGLAQVRALIGSLDNVVRVVKVVGFVASAEGIN